VNDNIRRKRSFSTRFAHFKKHALWALYFLKKAKAAPSKLLPERKKTSDRSGVQNFAKNRDRFWTEIDSIFLIKQDSQIFTIMNNRACEQTDLTGFLIRRGGYGMPGCPMFYRSARIDRPDDQPVKPDRMENSANSSATRSASQCLWRRHSARHGRNRHSSGIFTFFSFEEGSNFVQNIRHRESCGYIHFEM